jgi:hypothetical protein
MLFSILTFLAEEAEHDPLTGKLMEQALISLVVCGRYLLFFCLVLSVLLTSSSAASITLSNFDDACPILYSQADDFIKQCIEKARPLTWVFNGRKYV